MQRPPARVDTEALFRAHASFVARFLVRLGVATADVDDCVQQVFLVAHRKGGFVADGSGQPRSWLAAIAINVARTARRSHVRRREDGEEAIAELTVQDGSPEATLDHRRALQRVQCALQMLDVEHRAVFVLFELEGQECETIARSLGVRIGTVWSRLHHARRRFKKLYECADGTANCGARTLVQDACGGTPSERQRS